MSNPLIVYTAIVGSISDKLRPAIAPKDDAGRRVQYICFSDRITELQGRESGWEIREPLWRHEDNPRRTARWHKVNSHLLFPTAAYTLWLDGSHQLKHNPWDLVDKYLTGANIATFKHGERSCVYDELEACVKLKKDDPLIMGEQVKQYRLLGYPAKAGLFETSVLLRRRVEAIEKFNERWWQEIVRGSYRDQLSINWVADKLGVKVGLIPGNRAASPHFNFFAHK